VTGFVFGTWSHVDHHDVASTQTRRQLRAADRFDVVLVAEIRSCEAIDAGDVLRGDVTYSGPQLRDSFAAQRVMHAGAVAAARNKTGARERLQVMRRVGDALLELTGEVVDGAFALREHVHDFGPPPAGQTLGHVREGGEQRILGVPVAHKPSMCPRCGIVKYSNDHLTLPKPRRTMALTEEGRMRSVNCPCGLVLTAENDEALFVAGRQHADEHHADDHIPDDFIRAHIRDNARDAA
jgi:hypothetical protein